MTGRTNKQVLVTGGYGYLGGRVAQWLVRSGRYSVRLGTRGVHANGPAWLPAARPVTLDWTSEGALREACAGSAAVIHLAAMNEIESARDPMGALRVNGFQSLRLLEAAIAAKVGRFIYLSTAHVYGTPLLGEIDEQTLPRPVHPYAITHKVAEDFVLAAASAGRIEAVVLRLSNGFGAPAHSEVNRWTLLVNDLCRQAVADRALALSSSGTQRRDFVTLEDASRAVEHVLTLQAGQLGDGLFNLGGNAALRVIDMAELIASRCEALLGFRPPVNRPAPRPNEPNHGLSYSSEKLACTGFTLTRRHADEIDATLRLCQYTLGRTTA